MDITRYFAEDLYAGKTVFVTGGGSGINLGIAKNFAAVGANIAICGRTRERLDVAAKEIERHRQRQGLRQGRRRAPDPAALQAAIDETRAALGPIDVLVCGAAGNFLCRAEDLSPNGFKTVVDIDLIGSFHASAGGLRAAQGDQGHRPVRLGRHGLHALCLPGARRRRQGRHREHDEEPGARMGAVRHPFLLDRAGADRGHRRHEAAVAIRKDLQDRLERIPMQRLGTVDDIGAAAAFLASPMASYITGAQLIVDGGSGLIGSAFFNSARRNCCAAERWRLGLPSALVSPPSHPFRCDVVGDGDRAHVEQARAR